MRYPRILTCSSARPRYCSCPSAPNAPDPRCDTCVSPALRSRRTGRPQTATRSNPPGANTQIPPRHRPHPVHRPHRPAPAATTHPVQTTPPPTPANRSAARPTPGSAAPDRRIHRGLGGAVGVDHHPPGAQRSTSSAGQASPATTNATDSNPCGESTPTADGVWLKTLTCSVTSKA